MSRIRLLLAPVLLALVTVGAPVPAHADTGWSYLATAGGTKVTAFDGTVISDLTAQSGVTGGPTGRSSSNTVATAEVTGLLRTGMITTSARSAAVTDGVRVVSTAETLGVNLLDGLITADAIRTTASTTGTGSGPTSTSFGGRTEFVNLRIVGVDLPVNIPRNYNVTIPDVARISINGLISAEKDGGRGTLAWGLGVELLQERGNTAAGAKITVNPLFQMLVPTPPSPGARLAGNAYGTRVSAKVDGSVKVYSGPTAVVRTPYSSSNGKTLTNDTAAVKVPGVLTTGAVGSTSTSSLSGTSDATVVNTDEIARVNVLAGTVTADAIKVTARGSQTSGAYRGGMRMSLVNLKVAGRQIPLDVAPNTRIDVAGVGRVVVNQQIQNGRTNVIRGVLITLTTAQAGLPVGARIEIAVASTSIQ